MIKIEEKKTINEKLVRVKQDRKVKLCIVRKICSEGAKKEELAGAKQDRKSKLCILRDKCSERLMRWHNNGIKREEKYFKKLANSAKLTDSWNGCKHDELFE